MRYIVIISTLLSGAVLLNSPEEKQQLAFFIFSFLMFFIPMLITSSVFKFIKNKFSQKKQTTEDASKTSTPTTNEGFTINIGKILNSAGSSISTFMEKFKLRLDELKIRINELEKENKENKQSNNSIISTSYDSKDAIDCDEYEGEETKPRRKYIDKIQFEYRTASGNQQTYTVLVYKGLRGNLEGWCIEREGIRTFLPERIVNKEITKIDTGEILVLKDWRASFRKTKSI